MQSAGNFVAVGIELAAGVQLGHHDLRGGNLLAFDVHVVHGNAAAVVDDRDRIVDVNRDLDLVGVSGQRFVDRVVDDFVDQVVQSHLAGRADVHRRTQADGFHAFQNFDGIGGVIAVAVGGRSFSVSSFRVRDGRIRSLLWPFRSVENSLVFGPGWWYFAGAPRMLQIIDIYWT